MKDVPLMLEITREVVKAVHTPVTAKTRLGWDKENLIITTLAEQLQDCGIQALTIHGRTRSQMYTGEADWTLIGEVKKNPRIYIPIIGNGDITSPEKAEEAFDEYGVDAVMIGRATFGRPWFFKECRDFMNDKVHKEGADSVGAFCIRAGTLLPPRSLRIYPTSDRRASLCCGLIPSMKLSRS